MIELLPALLCITIMCYIIYLEITNPKYGRDIFVDLSMIYIIDVWCGERCFVDCDVLIFALDLRFFMNIGACCCLMVNDIDKIFVINSLQYCGLTECIKTVKNG